LLDAQLGLPAYGGGKIFHFIAKHFKVPPNHPDPQSLTTGICRIMSELAHIIKTHTIPVDAGMVRLIFFNFDFRFFLYLLHIALQDMKDEKERRRSRARVGLEKLRTEYIEKRDNDNLSPVFLAAIENNIVVFMELVTRYHADTDVLDKNGNTILHAALRWTKVCSAVGNSAESRNNAVVLQLFLFDPV
jgi:hypothetical protein